MFKISSKEIDKRYVVKINLDGDDWKEVLKSEWNKIAKNIEVKGFRKGNVPENVLKQKIKDEEVWDNSISTIVRKFESKIGDEFKKGDIVTNPRLNITKLSNEELEVEFSSLIFPKIKIGDLKKIKSKLKLSKTADAESLKAELENFKKNLVTKIQHKEPTKTLANNQMANIDYVGKVDGKEFESGSAKGYDLKIGSKSFIDNFEEQLIGMHPGDSKTIKVKFPEQYPEKKLANKQATFDVKLNYISEEKKLEGEDLKKRLAQLKFKDMSDVEKRISKFILERQNEQEKQDFFDGVVAEIIKLADSDVNLPDEYVDEELINEVNSFEKKIMSQGMKMDAYLKMLNKKKEDFIKENIRPNLIKKLQSRIIYSTLIKNNDIKVIDDDIEKEYLEISKKQGFDVEEIKKYLNKENILDMIYFKKIIDLLTKLNQ